MQLLTPSLTTQLVKLARVGFSRSGFVGLADEAGWLEQDGHFETPSGHRVVPAVPLDSWDDDQQPSFHLPFGYFDPSGDAEDGPLGDDFHEASGLDGWGILSAGERAFFEAWQHGCEMVSAELGQPEATAMLEAEADSWHFAAWRTASAAVVVAQGEEFSSYGELSMAAIWVLPLESGDPLPADGAGFYSWLLGED